MKKLFAILCLIALPLSAEPLKITNKSADELCGALLKFGPGLSGVNSMHVARAINVLRPLVDSYGAGLKAEVALKKITGATRTDSPEYIAYAAAAEALAASTVTVDLPRFTITPEEADRVASNTPPFVLSLVIQYLEPSPAKK